MSPRATGSAVTFLKLVAWASYVSLLLLHPLQGATPTSPGGWTASHNHQGTGVHSAQCCEEQPVDPPTGLVSIPPGCFWLVAGLIFILSLYLYACCPGEGGISYTSSPSYLRCLNRTRQTSSSFLGADRPFVRGLCYQVSL